MHQSLVVTLALFWSTQTLAQQPGWVTSWAGSTQGPYSVGNPSARLTPGAIVFATLLRIVTA